MRVAVGHDRDVASLASNGVAATGQDGGMSTDSPRGSAEASDLPVVSDVLDYPSLRRGDPVVIAGAAGLARRVRWVHVSEVQGIADLIHGGEILLTTGMLLPDKPALLGAYVEGLADAGLAALVIGLGPRYLESLPPAMVDAAHRRGLPLIALRRTIAFIDVTEEVHAALVDAQVRELRASDRIHTTFSSLLGEGADMPDVLHQVASLSGAAVVLENLAHQVIAFDPGPRSRGDVLAEWAEHTHRHVRSTRTQYDAQTGWLQSIVGARGDDWGRLVIMAPHAGSRDVATTDDPTATIPRSLVMLIERGAAALAIGKLVDRESELLDLNTQQSVLAAVLAGVGDPEELHQQAAALGVSLRRGPVAALAARHRDDPGVGRRRQAVRSLSALVSECLRRSGHAALVAPLDDFTVGVLAEDPSEAPELFARSVSVALAERGTDAVVAFGSAGHGVDGARAGLAEALETVAAAIHLRRPSPVVGWDDLGVRGLVYALREDPRLVRFANRTLGPLVRHDAAHDTDLVGLLRHFLAAGRNKTLAAQRAFVSRPWMHERLRLVESVLGLDLENEETCMNLQVALAISDGLEQGLPQ